MDKYSEYKEITSDWINKIPKHWKEKTLIQVAENQQIKNAGMAERNLLSLSYGRIIQKDINKTDGLLPASFEGYQIVHPGNIILRLTDLQNDHKSLRTGLVSQTGIITSAYTCLKVRMGILPEYLHLLLHSADLHKVFYGMGGGVRQSIGYKDIRYMPVIVPPLEEQDRIVRFLDWKISLINKLISSCKAEIDDLHEFQHQLINNAVCRGLESSELVNGSAASCHIGWAVKRFKECFSLRKGLTITKDDLRKSGVKVISYGQIHSKNNDGLGINSDLIRFVDKEYLSQVHSIAEQGDFLFADTSEDVDGCGNCVYIDSSDLIMAGYHTIIAHPKCSEISRYHAYLFQSDLWRRQIQKDANGVKVFSITQTMLKNSYILIPSKVEQEEIIRYLDARCRVIKKLINRKKMYLDHLHEMKNSLISDVVTGKIDVRNVAIPEYEYVPDIGSSELADSEMDEEESDNA